MLASSWPKPIRESEKIRFVDSVQHLDRRALDDFVFQRRDGQRELHTNTVSFWDGPRSGILFTHFVGKASQYLRHGG